MQGEAVGALAPLLSVPALLRGRPAIQFQDNTGGRSRLSCTATLRGPTWAAWSRVVNVFHLAQFALDARIWLEWVPSDANLADLPSRMLIDEMLAIVPGALFVPMVLPSQQEWQMPLASFAASMLGYLESCT